MRRFLAPAVALLVTLSILTKTAAAELCLIVPFHNASGSQNLEWIGESIAETIREALTSYGVPVIRRQERERAAHRLSIRPGIQPTKATVIKLATDLGADHVIFGSFEWATLEGSSAPAEGRMSIAAEWVDVQRATRQPAIVEIGTLAGFASLQTRVAWRTLELAAPAREPTREEFLENYPIVRIDAMENYIRGLLADDIEQRHRHFAQAARLDPDFAQPRFQLGRMRWEEHSYRIAAQWLESVPAGGANYIEANYLLGLCRYHSGDYGGALAAFDLVARQTPNGKVYNNIGVSQFRHRVDGALESLRYAAAESPLDPDILFNVGYVLWRQGDLKGAGERFRVVLEMAPDDAEARQMLDRCVQQRGPRRGDLSSEGLERLKERYDEYADRRSNGGSSVGSADR